MPYRPAAHAPEQAGVLTRLALPYCPGGHDEHVPAPPTLYCPTAQPTAVALVDPVGHEYPAAHGPLHADVASPGDAPKRPASHGPLHAAVVNSGVAPYRPALQLLQIAAPGREYCPGEHGTAVGVTEPAGHANPALQLPLQFAATAAGVAPKDPALHVPLQVATPIAAVAP